MLNHLVELSLRYKVLVLIIFAVLQRYVVQGIAVTGLKD